MGCEKHSVEEVLTRTTPQHKPGSMVADLKAAGNFAKCAFDSQVERTIESCRALMPHMTEMSRPEHDKIGPGAYTPPLRAWTAKFSHKDKGFGSGTRGLLATSPRDKPESFVAGAKRGRNLSLSMFATGYLRKSYNTPTVPRVTQLLA